MSHVAASSAAAPAAADPRSLAAARALPVGARTLFVELRDQPDLAQVAGLPQGPGRRAAAWASLTDVATQAQAPLLQMFSEPALKGAVAGVAALTSPNLLVVAPANAPTRGRAAGSDPREQLLAAALARPEVQAVWQLGKHGGFELAAPAARAERLVDTGAPHNGVPIAPLRPPKGPNGAGLTYGLVDTGFDAGHWALEGAWRGRASNPNEAARTHSWFDTTERARTTPRDYETHGTGVAGVAVGRKGLAGSASSHADLIVAATKTSGPRDHAWRKLLGIAYMQAPTGVDGLGPDPAVGPDVVGLSFGVKGDPHLLQRAIGNLTAAGTDVVVSAGNGGTSSYNRLGLAPGAYSIGATTVSNTVWARSSRGTAKTPGKPDFVAWGTTIPVALPNDGIGVSSGTSLAQPRFAAALLALRSARPDLTQAQVRDVLQHSAVQVRDVKTGTHTPASGWGAVTADAALRVANERFPAPPEPASAPAT